MDPHSARSLTVIANSSLAGLGDLRVGLPWVILIISVACNFAVGDLEYN